VVVSKLKMAMTMVKIQPMHSTNSKKKVALKDTAKGEKKVKKLKTKKSEKKKSPPL
jgi:hypothetical protein